MVICVVNRSICVFMKEFIRIIWDGQKYHFKIENVWCDIDMYRSMMKIANYTFDKFAITKWKSKGHLRKCNKKHSIYVTILNPPNLCAYRHHKEPLEITLNKPHGTLLSITWKVILWRKIMLTKNRKLYSDQLEEKNKNKKSKATTAICKEPYNHNQRAIYKIYNSVSLRKKKSFETQNINKKK